MLRFSFASNHPQVDTLQLEDVSDSLVFVLVRDSHVALRHCFKHMPDLRSKHDSINASAHHQRVVRASQNLRRGDDIELCSFCCDADRFGQR